MSLERILIVEDEGISAMNLEKKLEKMGYRSAGIAYTGEEAVRKACESEPDLVLMDIKLAGTLDGIEASRQIQRHRPTPIVYLTAFTDEPTLERAKSTSPYGYLSKPVHEPSVRTTIEMALNLFRVETRLRESEADFRSLFESSPAGAAIVDAQGMLVRANRALAELLGYDSEESLKGAPLAGLIDESGGVRRRDGGVRWVRIDSRTVHDTRTGAPLQLCVFVDISLQKLTELSNQRLREFTSIASHDLKAPARRAGSFLKIFARENRERLDARAREFLDLALGETEKLQTTVSDLLEYSQVCQPAGEPRETSLLQVADDALRILRPEIEARDARITVDPLPPVPGNSIQLVRLFTNLFSNAIKYCRGTPRVHVSARVSGEELELLFQDNGIGIAADEQERIFLIFHRSRAASEFPGSGIGLASCRQIVENHGGRIWVESELDHGSTFHVRLPLRQATRRVPEVARSATASIAATPAAAYPDSTSGAGVPR